MNAPKKFIFIHVQKCAGYTIRKALEEAGCIFEMTKHKHTSPEILRKKIGFDEWKNYWSFTFVRNPFDKMVSKYFHNKLNLKSKSFEKYSNFKDWVKDLDKSKYWNQSHKRPYVLSQLLFLSDDKGNLLVDFIGKFENLASDFQRVCDELCLPNKMPGLHINPSEHRQYREYYDDETRKTIERRFKEDLEYFGYEF
ncbi:sulfotransferase family 2 domain-containing protein [Planctomycetota bacterium]